MDTIEEDQAITASKRDALALAQLILDIYKDKNKEVTASHSIEAK